MNPVAEATAKAPAQAEVGAGAPPGPNPSEFRVALALSRSETRRLLVRPSTLIVILLGFLFAGLASGNAVGNRAVASAATAFGLLPLAAVTLINSYRATLRPERDGTIDVVSAAPATARSRTGSHLLALLGPVSLSVAVLVLEVLRSGSGYGNWVVTELAVGPLLVAGAGALGVLLARLVRHPLVPFAACFVIAIVEANGTGSLLVDSGWRWLAFWVDPAESVLLPDRRPAAHAAYLIGLIALAGLAALLRHGRTPTLTWVSLAVIAFTVAAAAIQTRPAPAGHWARADRLLDDPESFQRCDATARATFCMLPGYAGLAGAALVERVDRVAAAAPSSAWPDEIVVAQSLTPGTLQYTPMTLADRLPSLEVAKRTAPEGEDRVHVGLEFGWAAIEELGFGVAVANRLVGLPASVGEDATVCSAYGQARGAIALYLGARSSPRAASALGRLATSRGGPAGFLLHEADVFAGAVFDTESARLAGALLRQPVRDVRDALSRHWATLTDPASTTADVAALLGAPGSYATARSPAAPAAPQSASAVKVGSPCA